MAQEREGVNAPGWEARESGLRRPHKSDMTEGEEGRIGTPQTSESSSKIIAFNQTSLKHHYYPTRIDKAAVLPHLLLVM